MSYDLKTAWAILIAVLKNKDKDYEKIEDIFQDICDIREMIEKDV